MANSGTFLLLGPESGLKKQFIDEFISQKTRELKEEPELFRFYPFDTPVLDIISVLRNGSLFASSRLVIVNNAEEIKKVADVKLLVEYLKKPSDGAWLLLLSLAPSLDRKIESQVKKDHKKIFWEMFESDKKSWIFKFFQRQGLKIDPQGAALLLELVDNNTEELKRACESLSFYFKEGSVITQEDIDRFIYHSKDENVFTLFDKLAVKDISASLEILQKLFQAGAADGVMLVVNLTRLFRKLNQCRQMQDERMSMNDICRVLFIKGKRQQALYSRATGLYTSDSLKKGLLLLEEADKQMRSLKKEIQPLVLENTLIRIMTA